MPLFMCTRSFGRYVLYRCRRCRHRVCGRDSGQREWLLKRKHMYSRKWHKFTGVRFRSLRTGKPPRGRERIHARLLHHCVLAAIVPLRFFHISSSKNARILVSLPPSLYTFFSHIYRFNNVTSKFQGFDHNLAYNSDKNTCLCVDRTRYPTITVRQNAVG